MPAGRIDVHAHYLGPAYVEALHARDTYLIGGIPIPGWSPELALEFMDDHGIEFQMLSVSDPGVGFLEGDRAIALARACNEYVADVIRERPERFGAFAVLPLPDVEAARAEVAYCLDELGHSGIGLLSSYGGTYLGDEALEPLLADLDQRGSWVMVHPTAVDRDARPEFPLPEFVAEYPFDTTRTALSLLLNSSLKRFPRIRWQLAHGGGVLPMLRARLEALCAGVEQLGQVAVDGLGLPERAAALKAGDAADAIAAFFYDTALIADPPALEALRACAPSGQLMFGSDWPFAARMYPRPGDPQPALAAVFDTHVNEAILRNNAEAQFSPVHGAQRPGSPRPATS
jgi:6-methylsalicylate decarboxylase